MVVWLFLAVSLVCLRFVIVVFPDHTHYFYDVFEIPLGAFYAGPIKMVLITKGYLSRIGVSTARTRISLNSKASVLVTPCKLSQRVINEKQFNLLPVLNFNISH